jgi:hypothetical protein
MITDPSRAAERLTLSVVPPSGPAAGRDIGRDVTDVDLDDYPSLVMAVCDVLRVTDCGFRAGGFGHDSWYVDVPYDLSTVVEQLPEALTALRAGLPGEIDLYGQGVERSLHFSTHGAFVDVECRSRTSWVPAPAVVRHDRAALIAMVEKLAEDFGRAVAIGVPQLAGVEPFARWRRGTF